MRLNRTQIIRTQSSPRRGSAFVSVVVAALAMGLFAQCRARGLAPGSACTSAIQCEYAICEQRYRPDGSAETMDGQSVGTCAVRCESSSNCPASLICGRGNFRGFEPDGGMFTGPEHEIVRTCRPSNARECATDMDCQGSQRCLLPSREGRGVCAAPCTQNNQCRTTFRCLQTELEFACGSPGLCAPTCDDRLECPTGWRCEVPFSNAVFGRCLPVLDIAYDCPTPSLILDATDDNLDAPLPLDIPLLDSGTPQS